MMEVQHQLMLTVDEALRRVLEQASPLPPVAMPLEQALGRVLAEQITSDIDSPPHDKSMVDGYAVVSTDLADGAACLNILEEVVAGDVPTHAVTPGHATRIMTGAPIPTGADAVVMIERTKILPGDQTGWATVRIADAPARSGQNILPRGISMRSGDVVLPAGRRLRPIEIGLLAEVGRHSVHGIPPAKVAILSTGNELVPASALPGPGQIRNSNGPMLAASVTAAGGVPIDLGIGRDQADELRRLVAQGLEADVLILSGGVSAGVLDLVPGVLADLGVRQVFHKVQLKPGKPIWFGVLDGASGSGQRKLVFGLPGNPVSSLVCFELFVKPALRRLMGQEHDARQLQSASLTAPFQHRGDRPTYQPALLITVNGNLQVTPLRWQGSADLRSLAQANALIHFPAGERAYGENEAVEIVLI